jgi:hypothetical protein
MSDAIFVLGAGASKQAGPPLMADFLDEARDLLRLGRTGESAEHFEIFYRGISQLQQVHSKSQLDIHNVESVLAALEMASTLGRFGAYSQEEIAGLLDAARIVIAKTIEQTLRFPVLDDNYLGIPLPYESFADLLRYTRDDALPRRSVAVITFNYDIAVDFALERLGVGVDYALDPQPKTGAIPLLKLHGSLNWRKCKECSSIMSWPITSIPLNWIALRSQRDITLPIAFSPSKLRHCEKEVDDVPVIVPPTWNKTEYHRMLSRVWGRAARELQDAEDIYVMGYSLPASDAFFRYLYALGTVGEKPLRRFWVFDPTNETGPVKARFEELLGPGAKQRFRYFQKTFDAGIASIRRRL